MARADPTSRRTVPDASAVAEIDDAEPVAVRIGQNDEVGILREAVPGDGLRAQRQQPVGLRGLLGGTGHVQVEVQPGMLLHRRLTSLQGDHRPGSTSGRSQHRRPATEAVGADPITQGRAPEFRRPRDVTDPEHHHAECEHS